MMGIIDSVLREENPSRIFSMWHAISRALSTHQGHSGPEVRNPWSKVYKRASEETQIGSAFFSFLLCWIICVLCLPELNQTKRIDCTLERVQNSKVNECCLALLTTSVRFSDLPAKW